MKDFDAGLQALEQASARRRLRFDLHSLGPHLRLEGERFINFASNDYLGLSTHPSLVRAARRATARYGCGATASRLVVGNHVLNRSLEDQLAADYGKEAALVFPTGYMTNLGIFGALCDKTDLIVADRLSHASILDGIRLSGVAFRRFRHCDMADLERILAARTQGGQRFVVADSIFSMDGDAAPLQEMAALCARYDAFLVLDEAHANGIFGQSGLGLAQQLGVLDQVDLVMGTFSKALGSLGGFVAGSAAVIDTLINRARAFVFTTGLPPAVLAANKVALDLVRAHHAWGPALLHGAHELRSAMTAMGFVTGSSQSQIIPLLVGSNQSALALEQALYRRGMLVVAIRPPTVPEGTARLRISLCRSHCKKDVRALLAALDESAREVGLA